MYGLKRALQWHFCGVYEHWSNHRGIVLCGGDLRNFPMFMRV